MRRLANREEARHRAESVLRRQFGQAAVSVTRQSLAEDLLFALDELDETQPQWNVFDKDDPDSWPSEEGEYWVVWRYLADELRVEQGTWSESGFDGDITHWQPIQTPSPPMETE